MKPKRIHVKLHIYQALTQPAPVYLIHSLKNSVSINLGGRRVRIGDELSEKEAEALCGMADIEVVIVSATNP